MVCQGDNHQVAKRGWFDRRERVTHEAPQATVLSSQNERWEHHEAIPSPRDPLLVSDLDMTPAEFTCLQGVQGEVNLPAQRQERPPVDALPPKPDHEPFPRRLHLQQRDFLFDLDFDVEFDIDVDFDFDVDVDVHVDVDFDFDFDLELDFELDLDSVFELDFDSVCAIVIRHRLRLRL